MKLSEINQNEYKLHHTSRARMYVSRKKKDCDCTAEPYKGRYGEGYKVYTAAFDSSTYCYVSYYIKRGKK